MLLHPHSKVHCQLHSRECSGGMWSGWFMVGLAPQFPWDVSAMHKVGNAMVCWSGFLPVLLYLSTRMDMSLCLQLPLSWLALSTACLSICTALPLCPFVLLCLHACAFVIVAVLRQAQTTCASILLPHLSCLCVLQDSSSLLALLMHS